MRPGSAHFTVWSTWARWCAPTWPCHGTNPATSVFADGGTPPPCAPHSRPRAGGRSCGAQRTETSGCGQSRRLRSLLLQHAWPQKRAQERQGSTSQATSHRAWRPASLGTRSLQLASACPQRQTSVRMARADVSMRKWPFAVRPARTGPRAGRRLLTGPRHTSSSQWGSVPLPAEPETLPWTRVA